MGTYIIKKVLGTTEENIYENTKDTGETVATNFWIFNTSSSVALVTLCIIETGYDAILGALLYNYSLAANTGVSLGDRVMLPSDSIRVFASVADVVVVNIDIKEENSGKYPLPLL